MRSAELFAGCGGLALGVAQAGFKHELIVEIDSDAVETMAENRRRQVDHAREWNVGRCDTRHLDFTQVGHVDLLSGGPPCQPFSIGGRHLGPDDPRNMWPEAVRAVREMKPKAFVFENVRGLFRPAFSDYLDYIKLQLSYPDLVARKDEDWAAHLVRLRRQLNARRGGEPTYRVLAQAINAADYGAAQKRHRAIFIGISSEYGDDWEFPRQTHSHDALAWSKHFELDYWKRHGARRIVAPSSTAEEKIVARLEQSKERPIEKPWVTVRDAIDDLPVPSRREKDNGHWQHPGARAYPNHTGSDFDEPSKALKAGDHGVPGGENMVANRRGNVRYFTIREMARLQGFPDDYFVTGSWKAATRQLGNAVPTVVGRHMAAFVADVLRGGVRAART